MKYCIDTNIIIYAAKGTYPAIERHFEQTPSSSIVIPTIVIAEIEYGARKSDNYEKTMQAYKPFINSFEWVEFSKEASESYGKIRAELEMAGQTIGANDLIIASIAASEGDVLVTHNKKKFSRIPGLKIEDWTE